MTTTTTEVDGFLLDVVQAAVSSLLARPVPEHVRTEAAMLLLTDPAVVAAARSLTGDTDLRGCDECDRIAWALPLVEHEQGLDWSVSYDSNGDPDVAVCPSCYTKPSAP